MLERPSFAGPLNFTVCVSGLGATGTWQLSISSRPIGLQGHRREKSAFMQSCLAATESAFPGLQFPLAFLATTKFLQRINNDR